MNELAFDTYCFTRKIVMKFVIFRNFKFFFLTNLLLDVLLRRNAKNFYSLFAF